MMFLFSNCGSRHDDSRFFRHSSTNNTHGYLIRCDYFLHERHLFINKYYNYTTPKCLQIYPTHADRELLKQSLSSTIHHNNNKQTEKYVKTLLIIIYYYHLSNIHLLKLIVLVIGLWVTIW